MRPWLVCFAVFAALDVHAAEDPFAFDETADEVSPLAPVFDLLLRQDSVRDLPRPVDADFDRWEARVIAGMDWRPTDGVLMRVTGRSFHAEQDNDSAAFNLDNERLNENALDEAFLDAQVRAIGVRVGQSALPIELSPMVWDADLRWLGMALRLTDSELAGGGGLSWLQGKIEHGFGDKSELAAMQLQWRRQAGANGSSLRATLLDFDKLDTLPQAFRTNSRGTLGGLHARFRVADLHYTQTFGAGRGQWRFGLDLARNLEAEDHSDAARFDMRYGNASGAGGFEAGAAIQRIQADAVPAAFNDDDWWFPTRMRGHAAWLALGGTGGWQLRAMGLREKRDGADEYVQRLLLDLSWRY